MEHLNKTPDLSAGALLSKRQRSEYTLARNQYSEIPPAPSGYDLDDERESSGAFEYWRILRRHKGTWIIFAFVGALLGFLVTLPQTPVYQARTSIEIVGINDNFLNFKQASPLSDSGPYLDTSDIQTQVKLLQSDSLLSRVIASLQSNPTRQWEIPTHQSVWRKLFNLPTRSRSELQLQTLTKVASSLRVRSAAEARIIEVTVDSINPQLAADFANTLGNEFIQQNLEARWKTTERVSTWLTHQLDDMRTKLESSENALQTYARESGLIFTDEKINVSADKLRQLQQELSNAENERIAKQSRYEIAQASPPDALPDVLNDAGLREMQSKITDLRRQAADLSTIYTPEHEKVKRVQAQVATLQAALDRNRTEILNRIRDEYEEAVRREKLLTAAYNNQTVLVSGDGEKAIQYSILKREVDSNRQLYDTMLQQLKESSIASAMRASNVRVVDPAKTPQAPYKPNLPEHVGLGLFAGLFLGAVFIIVRQHADRTIQQPGETSFYLNIPELGIIPASSLDGGTGRAAQLQTGRNSLIAKGEEAGKASSDRVELVTWERKPSLIAESFRSTLISILFASQQEGPAPKVLVITSGSPGEGKSTVVSNLAIAMAEVGQQVLLIDGDLRKPRQHEIFNLENERGLSTILREKIVPNGDRSLSGVIAETHVPGLFVLTSGPGISAATNLLYGSYMPELLRYFRDQFNVVLIDSPPMLQIPDARVLGRMADKVIMVVRSETTTRDAALAAHQRFQEDGTEVLGTILNDWNPKASPNGYYGYYGSYTKYQHYYHVTNK